jgi:hypothetical protein
MTESDGRASAVSPASLLDRRQAGISRGDRARFTYRRPDGELIHDKTVLARIRALASRLDRRLDLP